MRWPRTVGVLGAGALGTLFAHGLAALDDLRVILLARSLGPDSVEVEGKGRVEVLRETNPLVPVDLLIVLVKAYATEGALRWAAGAIGPNTVALTLQNGLGNVEALAAVVGAERVLAGITAQGAALLEPGLVRHGGLGATWIAPWQNGGRAAKVAQRVSEVLTRAGFITWVAGDARVLLWTKLAVNAAINPLTAILGVTNGELLAMPEARSLMERAAREAGAVAKAVGVDLQSDPAERAVEVAQATAANRSSMLQDMERGRRTEIQAINGAVVSIGTRAGVPTPVNETLTLLVREMERRRL